MSDETSISRARAFWVIAAACLAPFMARLDTYIVNISLPTISKHFHAGTGTVSLVLLAYVLAMTSSMLVFGKLEDRLGLKNVFLWGYSVFVVGSLLCGVSFSISMLIVARALQGAGAAMLMTAAFTAVSRFIPHEKTGAAFGMLSMIAALGVSVGPALGGYLTGFFSWRWIFLVNAPVGILGALLAAAAIPELASRPASQPDRPPFDIRGAVLSALGLMALLYALNQGGEQGWTSPDIVFGFLLAAALLGLFAWLEFRHPAPLLTISLIKRKDFRRGLASAFFAYFLMAGNGFLMPFYLEYDHGLSPQKSGLVFSCFAGIALVLTPIAGRLSDRLDPGRLCRAAMIGAAATCLFFVATLDLPGLLSVVLTLVALGVAYSFLIPPLNSQLTGMAPADQKGAASGLLQTMIGVGMAVGVCSMETVYSHFQGMTAGFRAAYLLPVLTCAAAAFFAVTSPRQEEE